MTEIERLAKAGVTISLGKIAPVSDPAVNTLGGPYDTPRNSLEAALWARVKQVKTIRRVSHPEEYDAPHRLPFTLMAARYRDEVHITFHPFDVEAGPLHLVDSIGVFPSDALMASLVLWENNGFNRQGAT